MQPEFQQCKVTDYIYMPTYILYMYSVCIHVNTYNTYNCNCTIRNLVHGIMLCYYVKYHSVMSGGRMACNGIIYSINVFNVFY